MKPGTKVIYTSEPGLGVGVVWSSTKSGHMRRVQYKEGGLRRQAVHLLKVAFEVGDIVQTIKPLDLMSGALFKGVVVELKWPTSVQAKVQVLSEDGNERALRWFTPEELELVSAFDPEIEAATSTGNLDRADAMASPVGEMRAMLEQQARDIAQLKHGLVALTRSQVVSREYTFPISTNEAPLELHGAAVAQSVLQEAVRKTFEGLGPTRPNGIVQALLGVQEEERRRVGITAGEALTGFAAWLTTRPEPVVAGGGIPVYEMLDALREFMAANGIEGPREGVFPGNLRYPDDPDAVEEKCASEIDVDAALRKGTMDNDYREAFNNGYHMALKENGLLDMKPGQDMTEGEAK